MPNESPRRSRRGVSCAALIALSFAPVVFAQTAPSSRDAPTTRDAPTARDAAKTRDAATTRDGPPRARSLDEVRLDRRMTLLNAGETIEPLARVPDDAPSYVVELPSHKELILDLARRAGGPEPTVRVLPEESRTGERYGIVSVDHAILRKGVRDVPGDRENLSDVTLGEPVWILDADEAKTSLLVHASDGYLGWVDAAAVWPVDAPLFKQYGEGNYRRQLAEPSQRLPTDDALSAAVAARDASRVRQTLTDHREVRSPRAAVAQQAIARARSLLGTRYVWGGKTADGIDCSGLVQDAYARVPLPRDADQQSLVGRLVATRWDRSALLPGDLLFYVSPRRGNVHHVAIYLGDGEYLEAAGPDVHVSSMTPGAKNYDAKRAATFGWARRVVE